MFFNLLLLAADDQQNEISPIFNPMTIMLGLFLLFWLFVIRPSMKRQEAERRAMLDNLDKNDRVLTAGGIYGTVVSISDKEDEMTLNLGDNVKIRMTRSSVVKNFTKEEKLREAQEAAKEAK